MLNNRFKFLKESISTKENSFQFIKYCELTENQLAQILKFGDLRNLQLLGEKNGGGGFPCGSEVKASACNVGDVGLIPGLGRSPGEGNGNPLQYSCLENPMDRGAWWATVHGVAKSRTQLSDFTFN